MRSYSPAVRRGRLCLLCLIVSLGLALAAPPVRPPSPTFRMRVSGIVDLRQTVRQLRAEGFDIPYVDAKQLAIDVVGGPAERAKLEAKGLLVTVLPDPPAPSGPGTDALGDYLSPAEVATRLQQFETAYPALAQRTAYATDREGRTAWALKISDNVAQEEDEPTLLFVAQHHAREVMTPEVAIDIIDQLLSNYGSDTTLTRWVNSYEIWVVPNHNPDGADYVFNSDSNWRKNRRNNGDGSFGVDPNRNYPFQWGNSVCSGSSTSPSSDTYQGPSAASEPTTAGLVALMRAQRPTIAVSYHTYSELAIHPFGCNNEYPTQPDYQFIREMASEVAAKIPGDNPNTWYQSGSGPELLYEVDGEFSDWSYAELGAVGVTFELNTSTQGFQPDYATWRNSTVQRARAGWRYFFDLLDRSQLKGHVTNACSGAPLAATIGLAEATFQHGETPRQSEAGYGRYAWLVRPGNYTLTANLSGFRGQSWPTAVGFGPASRELRLVPTGSAGAAISKVTIGDASGDNDGQADPGETINLTLEAYATGEAVQGLTATVSSNDPYVTVLAGTANFGNLAAGAKGSASGVQIRLASDAPDEHVATISVSFGASTTLCAPSDSFTLRVTKGFPSCPAVQETLDTNPGWQIDNGTTSGGWAFGPPGVVGPPAAFTGTNVYGTNLTGNYSDNSDYRLTAGPFDLSGIRHAELRFARWLENEAGFDLARVQIRIGASGAWQSVWEGFGRDKAWTQVRYDVASLVDGEDEVYVRFQLISDTGTIGPGFYIDDLQFCGEELPGAGGKVKYKSHQLDDSNPAYANGNGVLDLNETATLKIDVVNTTSLTATLVSAVLSSDTPGVTIVDAVGDYPDLATGAFATSLAPHFTLRTSSGCGSTAALRLVTRWSDGQRATSSFTVPIGQIGDVDSFQDDMETDKGWTVGGDALAGQFVRANPNGVTDASVGPVQPEDDNTPAPGQVCYVTGNPTVGPGFNPANGDVDRGTTMITSPVFDGTNTSSLILRFARWFHRSGTNPFNDGRYTARISNNNGGSWTDLETLATNASSWVSQVFDITNTIPRTNQMRIRFEANETRRASGDPLIELLIDDVRITRRDPVCAPFSASETKVPNKVGGSLRVTRKGLDVALSWNAPAIDATHDAARFYPIYRSLTPTSGFASAGEPSATAFRDVDAAGPSTGSRYYLVGARNAAGSSGEEPTP